MKSRFDFDPTKIDDTEGNAVGADPLRIDPVRAVPDFSLEHTASLGLSQPVGMSIPPMAELDANQRKQRELMGRTELASAANTQPVNWSFNGGNAEEGKVPQQFIHEARKMLGTVDAMRGKGVNVNALTRKLGDGTVIEVRQIVGADGVETQTAKITVPGEAPKAPIVPKGEATGAFLWVGARIISGGEMVTPAGYPSFDQYEELDNDTKWFKPYLYVWEPDYTKTNEQPDDPTEDPPECLFLIESVGRTAFSVHPPKITYTGGERSWSIYKRPYSTYWADADAAYSPFPVGGTPAENAPTLSEVIHGNYNETEDPRLDPEKLPVGLGQKNTYGVQYTKHGLYMMEAQDDLENSVRGYSALYAASSSNFNGSFTPYGLQHEFAETTVDGGPMWVRQFESLEDPFLSDEEADGDPLDNQWETVAVMNPYRDGNLYVQTITTDPPGNPAAHQMALEKLTVDAAPYMGLQDESEFMEDDEELRGIPIFGEYAIRVGLTNLKNPPTIDSASYVPASYSPVVVQLRIRTGVGLRAQVDDYEITFNGWVTPVYYSKGYLTYPAREYQKYVQFNDLCPGGWYASYDILTGGYDTPNPAARFQERPFNAYGSGEPFSFYFYVYQVVNFPGSGGVVAPAVNISGMPLKYDVLALNSYAHWFARDFSLANDVAGWPIWQVNYYEERYPTGHPLAATIKWTISTNGPLASAATSTRLTLSYNFFKGWWRSSFSDPEQPRTYGMWWGESEYIGGYGACDDGPWWSQTFFADPTGGSRKATAEDPLPWGIQPEFTKQPKHTYELFPNGGARDPLAEA